MNGENIYNSAENKEAQSVSESLKRALGERAVLGDEYLSNDEQFAKMEQEQLTKEQAENEAKMKEVLEQFKKYREERERLVTEQKKRAEQIKKIEAMRREKAVALKRGGVSQLAGWYNKHPEELGEIIHPELQSKVAEYQKEHAETGKSFYDAIKQSMELYDLDAKIAEMQKQRAAIIGEAGVLAAEAGVAEVANNSGESIESESIPLSASMAEAMAGNLGTVNTTETADTLGTADTAEAGDEDTFDLTPSADEVESDDVPEYGAEDEDTDTFEVGGGDSKESKLTPEQEDEVVKNAQEELAKGVKEALNADRKVETIDEAREKAIDNTKKKFGLKYGFKKLAVTAAAIITLMVTLTSCTKNLVSSVNISNNLAKPAIETETESETPETPAMTIVDTESQANEAETNAERKSYTVKFQMENIDGQMEEITMDLKRDAQVGVPNPFDTEAKEAGEAQTADKKETKGAFGTILTAAELDGDDDAVERGYLGDVVTREASQPQLLAYRSAWGGSYDSVADTTFGGPTQENPLYRGSKLMNVNGEVSLENINHDAEIMSSLSQEELQRILDASTEAEARNWEGKTVRAVKFDAGRSYITAHIEKETDANGKDVYKLKVASSSKPIEFDVIQRINAEGQNEYDQGETKLNILKAHGLVGSDVTLEQAEQQGVMKRYTVWGERNKCGGQMVITENGVKKKATKKAASKQSVTQTITTTTQQVIPIGGTTTYTTTPDNPGPGPKPGPGPGPGPEPEPEPTPEDRLKPKTDTNPWADNNPSIMDVTKDFEQISEENNGARIVQEGQEQRPDVDTSGVNENPEDQQSWAEAPTAPEQDTGTGGLEDQSASSDSEAADMLREAESSSSSSSSSESSSSESSSSESSGE